MNCPWCNSPIHEADETVFTLEYYCLNCGTRISVPKNALLLK